MKGRAESAEKAFFIDLRQKFAVCAHMKNVKIGKEGGEWLYMYDLQKKEGGTHASLSNKGCI